MAKLNLNEEIEIPKGIKVEIDNNMFIVKGEKGELKRKLFHPRIKISKKENKIFFEAKKVSKNEKRMLFTFKAHIKNLIKGVLEPFVYKLKICSGHFPMNVSIEGNEVVIKNFLGERIPRKAKILDGVEAKVQGNEITLSSISKEDAGQTAANIEKATRISNRDRRVFGDGIFITEKAGKAIK